MRRIGLALLLLSLAFVPVKAQENPCAATGLKRLSPVMATHTLPPYPRESVRKNEQGITLLRVKISPNGTPYAVLVQQSSSSPRLDGSAAAYVKQRWRWSESSCPEDRVTMVSINWKLQNSPIVPTGKILMGLSLAVLSFLVWKSSGAKSSFAFIRNLSDKGRRAFTNVSGLFLLIVGIAYLTDGIILIVRLMAR
jgi:TonB family protein